MTFNYGEATVVIGPLAVRREPNAYDLCEAHAASLTVPQGWQVIRLAVAAGAVDPDDEDLELLANVVRQASAKTPTAPAQPPATWWGPGVNRRGHLRILEGE